MTNRAAAATLALAEFGSILLDLGRFADAEPLLRECVAIREKTQPDVWNTFNAKSMLGGALLGLAKEGKDAGSKAKRLAEAGPLLVQGYEGMKTREQTIPPQAAEAIPAALDRLIDFHTVTNKPEEVKEYRELRAKYPPAKHATPPAKPADPPAKPAVPPAKPAGPSPATNEGAGLAPKPSTPTKQYLDQVWILLISFFDQKI